MQDGDSAGLDRRGGFLDAFGGTGITTRGEEVTELLAH